MAESRRRSTEVEMFTVGKRKDKATRADVSRLPMFHTHNPRIAGQWQWGKQQLVPVILGEKIPANVAIFNSPAALGP